MGPFDFGIGSTTEARAVKMALRRASEDGTTFSFSKSHHHLLLFYTPIGEPTTGDNDSDDDDHLLFHSTIQSF
ncbi:unnamed protein product [Prunus armeniaca]|uniref:Uncharacterized protein n=1 Tax=Prunus armeniaca TaxID=36596 RepID=A0A6J5W7L0_PRUAR|nr:unnamed protein product [Prunus armeniaca]CAB4297599.1 unnamed protein product [Prunus armeniaca]